MKYTVLLQYPDYIDGGRPIHIFVVTAKSAPVALAAARVAAMEEEELTRDDGDPVDFVCVALYKGYQKNLNPELG